MKIDEVALNINNTASSLGYVVQINIEGEDEEITLSIKKSHEEVASVEFIKHGRNLVIVRFKAEPFDVSKSHDTTQITNLHEYLIETNPFLSLYEENGKVTVIMNMLSNSVTFFDEDTIGYCFSSLEFGRQQFVRD
jgi:hypothetical protein